GRAIALADRFRELGDPTRALAMSEIAVAASPRLWRTHLAAARAAAVGDPERAQVHLASAAALSGDGGAVFALACGWFLAADQPLAAVAVARRALALTAPGLRGAIYRDLARAQRMLGREADAGRTAAAGRAESAATVERVQAPADGQGGPAPITGPDRPR